MSAINDLRGLAGRLEQTLRDALTRPGEPDHLERARGLATLALELSGGSSPTLSGGSSRTAIETTPESWELDTMTETELALAFVLGSIERAIRRPERMPHFLRDALPRVREVRQHLERPRSG